LSALVLDDEVRQVLSHYGESHLVVVHDAGASRIPWEAVKIGTGYPALKGGLSHRYEADNLSVAKWLERRQASEVLSVLLVINPTLDLQGAEKEGKRIKSLFDALGEKVSCKLLHGNEAQKGEVLRCFGSGEYDVIHYAGHAFFDPNQRMRSGLLCANQEVLAGSDLAGIGNLPTMMFFNACEAARVRGQAKRAKKPPHPDIVRRGIGFAEALLRGGIANFIGTYWPVGDAAAEAFAGEFYRLLLEGKSLDDSTRAGREKVKEADSRDWADYVFYGDPDFVLKHGARP
jgi:CHAT domain-containing protein